MPRSGKVKKKQIQAEPVYNSLVVAKFINKVMRGGKKSLAEKIVYGAFDNLKSKGHDPLKVFEAAIENITPKMEVRPRRVGGASYMVPMEVRGARKQSLAISWLIAAARSRQVVETEGFKNKPLMSAKLSSEILEAAQGTGKAVSKREEMHRMAEANKAFAHFRW